MTFQALVVHKDGDQITQSLETLSDDLLPAGEVTIAVSYSTLNYKDGLCLTGAGGLVRTYPHVPGIDLVGEVVASDTPDFVQGDQVVLTGWRVGETRWGG